MNFNYNIQRNNKQALPSLLAKPKMLAWLFSLASPLQVIYNDFIAFREQVKYDLTINSQVNRLEKALRDKFADPGIFIEHPSDNLARTYIYTQAEQQPGIYLFTNAEAQPLYIHTQEYDEEFDFIVKVPAGTMDKGDEIYDFVDRYRLAGKRFKIEQI